MGVDDVRRSTRWRSRCRVDHLLAGRRAVLRRPFRRARGFECYVDQVREALDLAGLSTAAICGVSYGGLIAAAFAARYPERVSPLVLVSALPPVEADARVRFYLRAPRLLSPLFLIASLRMYAERSPRPIQESCRAWRRRCATAWTSLTHMFSPAAWRGACTLLARMQLDHELCRDRTCRR